MANYAPNCELIESVRVYVFSHYKYNQYECVRFVYMNPFGLYDLFYYSSLYERSQLNNGNHRTVLQMCAFLYSFLLFVYVFAAHSIYSHIDKLERITTKTYVVSSPAKIL